MTLEDNSDPEIRPQFGLVDLLQLVTICAVLAALVQQTGVLPAIFLAFFAAALMLKRGPHAVLALAAAYLLIKPGPSKVPTDFIGTEYYITAIAFGIGAWFRLKLWWQHRREDAETSPTA